MRRPLKHDTLRGLGRKGDTEIVCDVCRLPIGVTQVHVVDRRDVCWACRLAGQR